MHNWYDIESEGTQALNQMQVEQDFSKIYRDEFNWTLRLLRDIDFAQGNVLDVLYQKKRQDIDEDIELADIVAKEYRSGAINR